MQEMSGKAWASRVDGRFHGCGHDGHTTTLLYAAEYLARTRQFNGTLQLIFQPAEELLYGGRVMLEDGLFDQFPCDAIFGLHNMPGQPLGRIGLHDGAMMASSDTLHIEVKGWADTARYRSIPLTPRWLPVISPRRCNPLFPETSRRLNQRS